MEARFESAANRTRPKEQSAHDDYRRALLFPYLNLKFVLDNSGPE
jgi:hypothetical protein